MPDPVSWNDVQQALDQLDADAQTAADLIRQLKDQLGGSGGPSPDQLAAALGAASTADGSLVDAINYTPPPPPTPPGPQMRPAPTRPAPAGAPVPHRAPATQPPPRAR